MNREIKFRAWDGIEMHYKVCINHEGFAIKYGYRSTDWVDDAKAGIPMQFTGRKDRNGKEIYEGDICRKMYGSSIPIFVIAWNNERSMFIQNDGYNNGFYELDTNYIEVIGNIYEHHELLEN